MANRRNGPNGRKGGTPRWVFVFIPLGFVLLVGVMLWLGQPTGGPTHSPYESGDILQSSESPEADAATDGETGGVTPTPSGPEYDDNETIIE